MKRPHSFIAARPLLVLLGLILVSLRSGAQMQNLDSILRIIESNNPKLNSYASKMEGIKERVKSARSWEAPTAGAGFYQTQYQRPTEMGSLMFSFGQMIPNPQKQKAKADYLGSLAEPIKYQQVSEKQRLFAEARKAYGEWYLLLRKQLILRENEELLTYLIKISELHVAHNTADAAEVYQAQADLAKIQVEQKNTRQLIYARQSLLNALMNRDLNEPLQIDTTGYWAKQSRMEDIEIGKFAETALRRSDISYINASISAMQFDQRMQAAMRKPDFGLRFDHMQMFGLPNQFTFMGMITLPFAPWSAKEYKANIQATNFEIRSMEQEKEAMAKEIQSRLSALQIEIQNKRRFIDDYHRQVMPSLETAYQTLLKRYEENETNLYRLLMLQKEVLMAQMELLDQMGMMLMLQIDFERELER